MQRDSNTYGNKLKVRVYDKGFGGWRKNNLSISEALALVSHYYGEPHDKEICKNCQPAEENKPKSLRVKGLK